MRVAEVYDNVCEEYADFYNHDWYSIEEDRFLADLVDEHLPDKGPDAPLRVLDLGCGAGLPRVIWDRLSAKHEPDGVVYEGYDLSEGMIETANEAFNGRADSDAVTFSQGDICDVLPELPSNAYDLVVSLHGVLSHIPRDRLPDLLREVARVTDGIAVLGFFSREADCRAPGHPRVVQHTCRQLGGVIEAHTFTGAEVLDASDEAGLRARTVRGVGVRGATDEVHAGFVARQKQIQEARAAGEDVQDREARLRREIHSLVQADARTGAKEPERAHEIFIIATA